MALVAVAALCVVTIFLVLWAVRRIGESHEETLRALQAAHDAQVKHLLNRIQAPEIAISETVDTTPTPRERLFTAYDDDDAYWKTTE